MFNATYAVHSIFEQNIHIQSLFQSQTMTNQSQFSQFERITSTPISHSLVLHCQDELTPQNLLIFKYCTTFLAAPETFSLSVLLDHGDPEVTPCNIEFNFPSSKLNQIRRGM